MPKRKQGLTTAEFAALMGVTSPTVSGWEKKGWIIRFDGDDRSIDPAASAAEVDRKRDRKSVSRGKADKLVNPQMSRSFAGDLVQPPPEARDVDGSIPVGMDLDQARLLKEYWLSERARLDAQKTKGELLDANDVLRTWQAIAHTWRANFENLDARLAADMHGLDIVAAQAVARRAINETLAAIANNPPEVR